MLIKGAESTMAKPTKRKIRVLIVADDVLASLGLRMLIGNNRGMLIIGEAQNRLDALEIAAREHPDVILLDLDTGALNFMREVTNGVNESRVLVLSGSRDLDDHRRAVRAGAAGLVLKHDAENTLVKAIEKVYAGQVWLDRSLTASVLAEMSRATPAQDPETDKITTLTQREREIITLICEGLKNNRIGDRIFISEATVRNHVTSILSKLRLTDRFELAIYSFHHGLAEPPHHLFK
jgi:two-component system nitrate/nitrite response regulator NarL